MELTNDKEYSQRCYLISYVSTRSDVIHWINLTDTVLLRFFTWSLSHGFSFRTTFTNTYCSLLHFHSVKTSPDSIENHRVSTTRQTAPLLSCDCRSCWHRTALAIFMSILLFFICFCAILSPVYWRFVSTALFFNMSLFAMFLFLRVDKRFAVKLLVFFWAISTFIMK